VGTRLTYTAAAVSFFGDGVHAACLVLTVVSCGRDVLRDARIVARLLRHSRQSTEAGASNLLDLLFEIIHTLETALDVARHVAVLYAASDGTATTVRTISASVGGRQLALTNVDVMSATFTASVVLNLRTVWVSGRSRGKVLPGLTTRFDVRVVYEDDGEEHETARSALGPAVALARLAPRRVVSGGDGPDDSDGV
jgi:hypothetical protein